VDLSTLADDIIKRPSYRVVSRQSWIGVRHTALYGQVKALAEHWNARYLVVDATGVGAGLSAFLDRALPGKVLPFLFNGSTKSQLGWDFLSIVETGRFKDYSPADRDQEEFILQLSACQMEIKPGPEHKIQWGVPDGTRDSSTGELLHDDWILSAALCGVLDAQEWAVTGPALVVRAQDPLETMDEGF
jgi:hypothetical protein